MQHLLWRKADPKINRDEIQYDYITKRPFIIRDKTYKKATIKIWEPEIAANPGPFWFVVIRRDGWLWFYAYKDTKKEAEAYAQEFMKQGDINAIQPEVTKQYIDMIHRHANK
jgi:hypothetical protein